MYDIVFLINRGCYETKLDRGFFHSIVALFKHEKVRGISSGPGWEGWNTLESAQVNLDRILNGRKCHLVISYKPLEIPGFADLSYPKCLRYDEMYDIEWTLREIAESNADVVVCHYYNAYEKYKEKYINNHVTHLVWIPLSVEASIFKPDATIEKKYDVALIGSVHTVNHSHYDKVYPLRERMFELLKQMPPQYKCVTIPNVGIWPADSHTDKHAIDFAAKINSAKIIVTGSAVPRYRFPKYVEVPMCGVALAGDVYDDHPKDVERLKSFLIEINMQMSDEEIIHKLVYYLEHTEEREEKIKNGIEYAKDFTQEKYADRFLSANRFFLESESLPKASSKSVLIVTATFNNHPQGEYVEQSPAYACDYKVCSDESHPSRSLSLSPRLKAKIPKMLEWEFSDYDYYIWIDSKFHIKSPKFAEWMIDALGDSDICLFRHPDRPSIKEELDSINQEMSSGDNYTLERYSGEDMDRQVNHYLEADGFTDDNLFSCGLFIYSKNLVKNKRSNLMTSWMLENVKYSLQDQLSLPFILWRDNIKFNVFDVGIFENEYVEYDWVNYNPLT